MSEFTQLLLGAGLTASLLPLTALASSETGEFASALSEHMIEWIASNTELLSYERPDIRFATGEWMAARLNQKNMVAPPEALYGMGTHTLYLSNQWSPTDLRDQSILLHELVHHLQLMNETHVACPAQYNGLAYQVQIAWLREAGESAPFEFLGIGPIDIFVQSLCADPWGSLIEFLDCFLLLTERRSQPAHSRCPPKDQFAFDYAPHNRSLVPRNDSIVPAVSMGRRNTLVF